MAWKISYFYSMTRPRPEKYKVEQKKLKKRRGGMFCSGYLSHTSSGSLQTRMQSPALMASSASGVSLGECCSGSQEYLAKQTQHLGDRAVDNFLIRNPFLFKTPYSKKGGTFKILKQIIAKVGVSQESLSVPILLFRSIFCCLKAFKGIFKIFKKN